MTTTIHRRLAAEHGVSLIEMMVAILILGVVLSAFASTLTTALVSLSRDETRVRANHLANELAENLRAAAWEDLGFYADDPGYSATYSDASGAHDTVELGPTRGSNTGPVPGPQSTSIDGISYTTTANIHWLDDEVDGTGAADADGDLHDVKAFHILVQWSTRGQSQQLVTQGVRPPTIDEVPVLPTPAPTATVAPGTFAITDFTVLPTAVTISPSGTTQQEILATLTTSLPAIVPTLAYNSGSIGMQAVAGSGGTVWSHTIAVGDSTFFPGSYDFIVTATGAAGGTDSATVAVGFTQPSLQPVQVLTPSPAPGTVMFCKQAGNTLKYPVTLQWEVLGLGGSPGDAVTIGWNDQTGSAATSYVGPNAAGDGSVWKATIPANDPMFNKSVTTVTVKAVRAVDAASAAESYVYTIGGGCP